MRAFSVAVAGVLLLGAGCGSSSSGVPTIAPARTFQLADFSATPQAGRPATVAFKIDQPSGAPLVNYRKGGGPHTGVHLIIVRSDLGAIIHRHPPMGPGGRFSEQVTFPTPGRYRVVVDAYPALAGPLRNFQVFRWITVPGSFTPKPVPSPSQTASVDGFHFTMHAHPALHAIEAATLKFTVTAPGGAPASFTPWYGALAHAIFFRSKTLDYFHTHVCSTGATGCTSIFAGKSVTGRSSKPGQLNVGVLFPIAGTWRLFLQTRSAGHVVTAPFTLEVR